MTTKATRHRWSDMPHLVRDEFDTTVVTYCGKWYPNSMTVPEDAEWFCICTACRDTRARVKSMKFYETPILRKNRPTDAKKLRRDLRALDERRKLERFTGMRA